jgi:Dyp-type peroxidase family
MTVRLELDDIQGNVLQGYGLPTAAYVHVRVREPRAGRELLRELTPLVRNARDWGAPKPASALNVALSYQGLLALGVPAATLRSFPPEFQDGMAARAQKILGDCGDSAPGQWEDRLRAGRVHLLLVVHAESGAELEDRVGELDALVRQWPGLEPDEAPQRAALLDAAREHFGYADGSAQPAIAGAPGRQYGGGGVAVERTLLPPRRARWRPLEPGEFVLGYPDEDGVLPDAPEEPYGRNGTFMVYRKLRQDVAAFRRLLDRLEATDRFSGSRALAAAKLAGRWPSGAPLLTYPGDGRTPPPLLDKAALNDFRYDRDAAGHGCPIGAHIRRANPRDGLFGGSERTRRHRIVRRGMPYGPPLDQDARDNGHDERGLIFVCFNASLARQFETVNRWLRDGDIFGIRGETDPLTAGAEGWMCVQGNPPTFVTIPAPLVHTRGGEYLFLPGLTALAALAESPAGARLRPVDGRRRT